MKTNKLLTIFALSAFLCGCAVPVRISKIERKPVKMQQTNMEFIGFKNLDKNNIMFATFAQELEKSNIADNRQNYYLGNYSLQDLQLYQSKKRYVTFIESIKSSYGHRDIVVNKKDGTEISYVGLFTLYVYDTIDKSIVWTKTVKINEIDTYEGSYYHKDTDFSGIDAHYRNIVFNTIIDKYVEAYNFVNTLQGQ